MRVRLACTLALALLLGGAEGARADPINGVAPGSLSTTDVINFNAVALGNHDEIIVLAGASFGERFAGQALGVNGDFDVLTGTPTGPLTLLAGAPGRNLDISAFGAPGNRVISGLGPVGFPSFNAIGEGALAVLFDADQSELGIDILATEGGTATFNFFRRDGSLIDRLLFDFSGLLDGPRAFRREGGVADIAGFSVHNNDPFGLAYDNLRFSQGVVPEPASLILFGAGALGVIACGYRRRWTR